MTRWRRLRWNLRRKWPLEAALRRGCFSESSWTSFCGVAEVSQWNRSHEPTKGEVYKWRDKTGARFREMERDGGMVGSEEYSRRCNKKKKKKIKEKNKKSKKDKMKRESQTSVCGKEDEKREGGKKRKNKKEIMPRRRWLDVTNILASPGPSTRDRVSHRIWTLNYRTWLESMQTEFFIRRSNWKI